MSVTINGSNTPTAGGVTYGDGSNYATTSAGAAGGVLYSAGSSAPAFTAAGTSGQVLTSAGSGAPTWTTPSSGALTLVATVTASGSSTALFETGIDSTYDNYVFIFNGVKPSSNAYLYVQLKINGSYQTTWYRQNQIYLTTGGSVSSYTAADGQIGLTASGSIIGSQTGSTANGELWLYNPSNSAIRPSYRWALEATSDSFSAQQIAFGGGIWDNGNGAVTGVKFYASTGTINGSFRLYGYKNS